jgi:hypothetical protein
MLVFSNIELVSLDDDWWVVQVMNLHLLDLKERWPVVEL